MYGGSNVGGDIVDAFQRTTRRISMEVAPGTNTPFETKYGKDLNNLPLEAQRDINNQVTAKAIDVVNKQLGISLGNVVHGTGGFELLQNPSTVQQAIASKETAIEAAARLGIVLQQDQVWVNTPKALTQNPQNFSIDIIEEGGEKLRDSDKLTELFNALIEAEPRGLIRGYQPVIIGGKPGIRIIVTRESISAASKAARKAKEKIKIDDLVQYVQDFANTDLEQVLEKVDIYAQVNIMESDLTILENKWGTQKNGEGYKSYIGGQSKQNAARKNSDTRVLDTDGLELENLFRGLIEKAKSGNAR